jgi:hypothetical protein
MILIPNHFLPPTREEKEIKKRDGADMGAPPPSGVHVSKTVHKNRPTVKFNLNGFAS